MPGAYLVLSEVSPDPNKSGPCGYLSVRLSEDFRSQDCPSPFVMEYINLTPKRSSNIKRGKKECNNGASYYDVLGTRDIRTVR